MSWFSRVGSPKRTLKAIGKEIKTFSKEELDMLIEMAENAKSREEAPAYLVDKVKGFVALLKEWL